MIGRWRQQAGFAGAWVGDASFQRKEEGMQVVLKVVGGKNNGREIAITVPKFVIGRGEEAHLRPTSDLVSRNHTAISVDNGKVVIEDMNSRNGTFVNGEQIAAPHVAKSGDSLRVGRLQFEVVIDHVKPGNKKPKIQGVVEAASRTASTASSKKNSLDDSIADWLVDEDDGPSTDTKTAIKNAETIQMKLEETLSLNREEFGRSAKGVDDSTEDLEDLTLADDDGKKKKKKQPGKLPPVPKMSHGSSTTAADDVLRRFFNRR